MTYQKRLGPSGDLAAIVRLSDGAFIPLSESNRDYVEYLAWVQAGNTPEDDPGHSLVVLKAEKNSEINAWRLAANFTSFTHDGVTFSCDQLSRSDIDGTCNTILVTGDFPQPWPGYWKAADNSLYPIDSLDDWRRFYASMGAAGVANFNRSEALKARLAAATTPEEIAQIQWDDA